MSNDINKMLTQQILEIQEAFMLHVDADSPMPCSITDDPYNDYSHWHDNTGPYAQSEEQDCFDAYREERDRAQPPEIDPNEPNNYESKTHGY